MRRVHARVSSEAIDGQQWASRAAGIILLFTAIFLMWGSQRDSSTAQGASSLFQDMITPVIAFISAPVDGVESAGQSISSFMSTYQERDDLLRENMMLRKWQDMAMTLQSENEALRELLNYIPPVAHSYVSASVVADHSSPFSQTLLINRGASDGLNKGQAVMSSQGLVGRIMSVGEASSRVLLLTDRSSRVPVISEKTGYRAILAGNGNMVMSLLHVPPSAEMEPGERLITSGDGGLFAHGLPVGSVQYLDQVTVGALPYFHDKGLQKVSIVEMGRPALPRPFMVQ